jgi:TnpA family transposase
MARRLRVLDLFRYPPAYQGKAGVTKMELEDRVLGEIEETLRSNHLDLSKLLSTSGLREAFTFFERTATSTLNRWHPSEVLQTLPLYLAERHRQGVDALLYCFVRRGRLLHHRLQTLYGERMDEENRTLFERHGGAFSPLRRAVLDTLQGGDPAILHRYRRTLSALEERQEALHSREGYFDLLASRGTFVRKLTLRLRRIPLEGHDPHARAVVATLPELFRYAPFAEPIPREARRSLSFLDVDDRRLAQRRIFETIVATTLAEMLFLRRVTSPASWQYRDLWKDVSPHPSSKAGGPSRMLSEAKAYLASGWETLPSSSVTNGHLTIHTPSRKRSIEEERAAQRAREKLLRRMRAVSIVEVMARVHRSTGMLGAFRPSSRARRHLASEDRVRLALAAILARGMNVGITQMASLLRGEVTLGSLTNFDENHLTAKTLQESNRIVQESWQSRGMGLPWGSGEGVVADGKSQAASERTLLSGSHFRHRIQGMTLYWVIRDDWIVLTVGVIGNHEWESWYLLDALLMSVGGKAPTTAVGDTEGQHLALWGLAWLLGKMIRPRFRNLSRVKLYRDASSADRGVENTDPVRWSVIERAWPSLMRLASSVQSSRLSAKEALQTWALYDEEGQNVIEALRELGKAIRTGYLLEYARSEPLRREVREACTRAEFFNSFAEAVYWGHGGRMKTLDPERQRIDALCLQLVMNSIIYYTVEEYGAKLARVDGAKPATWDHIRLLGDYPLTSTWFTGENRRGF